MTTVHMPVDHDMQPLSVNKKKKKKGLRSILTLHQPFQAERRYLSDLEGKRPSGTVTVCGDGPTPPSNTMRRALRAWQKKKKIFLSFSSTGPRNRIYFFMSERHTYTNSLLN